MHRYAHIGTCVLEIENNGMFTLLRIHACPQYSAHTNQTHWTQWRCSHYAHAHFIFASRVYWQNSQCLH